VSTTRRTILVYCKHGLLTPVVDPVDNGYYFNDEAIRMLRRIEALPNALWEQSDSGPVDP
jgi:DNA-binding transcriptional MerR regulator